MKNQRQLKKSSFFHILLPRNRYGITLGIAYDEFGYNDHPANERISLHPNH